jgi:hypothetical protein
MIRLSLVMFSLEYLICSILLSTLLLHWLFFFRTEAHTKGVLHGTHPSPQTTTVL